ncbi:hypothetical protein LSAT2_016076, partial [Lamellibrachia satsuma]
MDNGVMEMDNGAMEMDNGVMEMDNGAMEMDNGAMEMDNGAMEMDMVPWEETSLAAVSFQHRHGFRYVTVLSDESLHSVILRKCLKTDFLGKLRVEAMSAILTKE